jgi:hypothetical protein
MLLSLRAVVPDEGEAISEPSMPGFLPQAALHLERGGLAMTDVSAKMEFAASQ